MCMMKARRSTLRKGRMEHCFHQQKWPNIFQFIFDFHTTEHGSMSKVNRKCKLIFLILYVNNIFGCRYQLIVKRVIVCGHFFDAGDGVVNEKNMWGAKWFFRIKKEKKEKRKINFHDYEPATHNFHIEFSFRWPKTRNERWWMYLCGKKFCAIFIIFSLL